MDRPDPTDSASAPRARWTAPLTSGWAAGAVLLGFWLLLLASVRDKSLTVDEGVHLLDGTVAWRLGDFRINPENGTLPQRVMAIPQALSGDDLPPLDTAAWAEADKWGLAHTWLYRMGNDANAMAWRGRAAASVWAVALGALVWAWARRLFGREAAMVALLLLVLSPTMLANGPLMTSDTPAAFFFLAAVGAWWRLLDRITFGRLALCVLACGGLFATKMSAVLILPMMAVMATARLVAAEPLRLSFRGRDFAWGRKLHQAGAMGALVLLHGAGVWLILWALFGFRYSASAPGQPPSSWRADVWEFVLAQPPPRALLAALDLTPAQQSASASVFSRHGASPAEWSFEAGAALEQLTREVLTPEQRALLAQQRAQPPAALAPRLVHLLREHRILPEAFLYGQAHAWRYAQSRGAFLNGDFRLTGWRLFFPYTFLVKTPLPTLALLVVAGFVASRGRAVDLRRAAWRTLPLWTLLGLYWAAAIASSLNIGHRHILATYPPLFLLGAAAVATAAPRWARVTAVVLLAALAGEVAWRFPHYLAYFNGIVSPTRAWRHLVDSSLDWGQDLPGLQHYLAGRAPGRPVHLSYFGEASPRWHGIDARLLPARSGRDRLPAAHTVETPTAAAAEAVVRFLQEHPEYDGDLIGRHREGAKTSLLFIKKGSALRLGPGIYCISATQLQPLTGLDGPWGPWNARYEGAWQALRERVAPLLRDDPVARRAALQTRRGHEWRELLEDFEELRFARLTAYLRQRTPDDHVGYSILIYELDEGELDEALNGPPAELGPDLPAALLSPKP